MWGEQLREEAKTIRERTVTIRLSDADCERLAEKAGAVGLSVGDLLKFFINDLVCGTQSNGSDERDLAAQWFDRVGFEQVADNTFLRWLIRYGDVRDFIGHYELMKDCKEDLASDDPVNSHADNEDEMEFQRQWIKDAYNEYATGWGAEKGVEPFDAAVERVLKWDNELHELKGLPWSSLYKMYPSERGAAITRLLAGNGAEMPAEPDYEPEM